MSPGVNLPPHPSFSKDRVSLYSLNEDAEAEPRGRDLGGKEKGETRVYVVQSSLELVTYLSAALQVCVTLCGTRPA